MINDFLNNSPVFQPNIERTSISGDCSPRAGDSGRGGGEKCEEVKRDAKATAGEKGCTAGVGRGHMRKGKSV